MELLPFADRLIFPHLWEFSFLHFTRVSDFKVSEKRVQDILINVFSMIQNWWYYNLLNLTSIIRGKKVSLNKRIGPLRPISEIDRLLRQYFGPHLTVILQMMHPIIFLEYEIYIKKHTFIWKRLVTNRSAQKDDVEFKEAQKRPLGPLENGHVINRFTHRYFNTVLWTF